MAIEVNPRWTKRGDAIAAELLRLAVACDVKLHDPVTIERIIRNDHSVCGRKNERGFRKLRVVLVVTYIFLGESIERIGPEATRKVMASLAEHMYLSRGGRARAVRKTNDPNLGYSRLGNQLEQSSGGGIP